MLHSSRLLLRALQPDDLNTTYVGWLNDPAVNSYLETRFLPQTLESLQSYWEAHRDDPASPWFAICLVGDGRHIGNIKLGLTSQIWSKPGLHDEMNAYAKPLYTGVGPG